MNDLQYIDWIARPIGLQWRLNWVFSQLEKILNWGSIMLKEVDEREEKGRLSEVYLRQGILNMQMNWRYNRASMKMKRWHAWRYVPRPPNKSSRFICEGLLTHTYKHTYVWDCAPVWCCTCVKYTGKSMKLYFHFFLTFSIGSIIQLFIS